jgi:hypothetical protein
MRRLTDMFADSGGAPIQNVGPDLVRDQNETLASVADALSALALSPASSSSVKAGLNNFANLGIYRQSPQLYLTTVAAST